MTQRNYTDAKAPQYIVCASGGNPEGLSQGYTIKNFTAAFDNTHYGWGMLTVVNETRLTWTFFSSATTTVLDQMTIDKPARYAALLAAAGSVLGDPQFIGLRGQSYQVHGVDNTVYNLISDATMQLNARFTYLDQGECLRGADGLPLFTCWTHSGSYLQSLALQTAGGEQVELVSGSARTGFALVRVGNESLTVGDFRAGSNGLTVTFTDIRTVRITGAGLYSLTAQNSDAFVNIVSLEVASIPRLTKEVRSHGLIGQTWKRDTHGAEVKDVEGFVDDYAESANDLFGCDFVYNKFAC